MLRYKTAVTDYEGLQGVLDAHSQQGWRLLSVTPDTWRKSVSTEKSLERLPFEQLTPPGDATQEYSASYYLLVFQREENAVDELMAASADEPLAAGGHNGYED